MTPTQTPKRISGPTELLQAIPYLLGFHPAGSLVVVGLRRTTLVVTARLDLADCRPPVVADVVATLHRGGSTSLVAAVYGDKDDQLAGVPTGDGTAPEVAGIRAALEQAADDTGCELMELLLVARGRWRSVLCDVVECCPPQGRELPDAVSAFAADATFRGVVALPDRATLERTLDSVPDTERLLPALQAGEQDALAAVLRGDGPRRTSSAAKALVAAGRAAAAVPGPDLDEADVVRFGIQLAGRSVRDAVWLAIDARRVDGRVLWRELARRLPSPYAAPALFLFGWASWRAGDGALAGIAAERALRSDPGCSAARLLLSVLEHGLDPRVVPRLSAPGPLARLAESA